MSTISLSVSDCMTRDLITVTPDTEITKVVHLMVEADVSVMLVVDDGTLVGILTERDCIAAAPQAAYYDEWGGPVSKFMSAPVETISPDESLVDVAVLMAKSRHRSFPVIDGERLVGLLSRRDLLKVLDRRPWFTPGGQSRSDDE